MTNPKTPQVQPSDLHIEEAQAAFDRLQPTIDDVPSSNRTQIRLNVMLATAYVHSIAHRDLADPDRRAAFEDLASSRRWSRDHLFRLQDRALATFHCRIRLNAFEAGESSARVEPQVIEAAQEIRQRMLRVLEYHLRDHEDYTRTLAYLRRGTRYQDLVNQLMVMRDMYIAPDIQARLRDDDPQYEKADIFRAVDLANQIFRGLGLRGSDEAQLWSARLNAAFFLMSESYSALADAGRLLFREEEDVTSSYPSLYSVARRRRSRATPAARVEAARAETAREARAEATLSPTDESIESVPLTGPEPMGAFPSSLGF